MKLVEIVMMALSVGVPLGCAGGQTGDIGTGDGDELCTTTTTPISVADAEAAGFAVQRGIGEMTEGRSGAGQELLLQAPVALWTEQGLVPPANRSTLALLTVSYESAVLKEAERAPDAAPDVEQPCVDAVALDFSLGLELPELGLSFAGRATSIDLIAEQPSAIVANCTIPGLSVSRCHLSSAAFAARATDDAKTQELQLDSGLASSACLDEDSWQSLPDVERGGAHAADLFADTYLLDLTCDGGGEVSVEVSVDVPERACAAGQYPVVIDAISAELGLGGPLTAWMGATNDSQCRLRDCPGFEECLDVPLADEQYYDAHPEEHCSLLHAQAEVRDERGTRWLYLTVEVAPNGSRLVEVRYAEGDWTVENARVCYGQLAPGQK